MLPPLGLQRLAAAGLLGHLALQPGDVLPVVLQAGGQHGGGAVALRGLRLRPGLPLPQPLRLHIALPHPGAEALRVRVDLLQGLAGRLQLLRRLGILRRQGLRLAVEPVQRLHPQGDLQPPLLVPEDQVFLRGLRLLLQRVQLQFQLVDLVVDPQEVFLRAVQLALRLLLAGAEAGDACGLLKDLPPVGAAGGDDLRDPALADDAVAVPAQARVHQQARDVPQAHGLAVEIVFALAAAVIAPGDGDLRRVVVKQSGGVVQHQAHLGKAHGGALLRAAEHHVLHLAAPQRPAALLPHDPQQRVGDIRFSAPVGADNGGDVPLKAQHRLIGKGLEALDLQPS